MSEIGWNLEEIKERIDDLYKKKNELILKIQSEPIRSKKLAKEILQIESIVKLNEEVRDFLLERDPQKFH